MTTIAYRDGVLAFDEQVTWNDVRWASTDKALKTKGMLIATSGSTSACNAFRNWMAQQGPKGLKTLPPLKDWTIEEGRTFDAFVVYKGEVWSFDGASLPYPIRAPFVAMGSGMQFAMGAMEMGATAEEAVRVATKFDTATGGVVRTLKA